MPKSPLPDIAVVGPGKVGVSIARLAQSKGYKVVAVAGRDLKKAKEAAKIIGPDVLVCDSAEVAVKNAQLILLTTSDDAIESTCQQLSQAQAFKPGSVVVHLSGSLNSNVLQSAKDLCQSFIASAHPLQTFVDCETSFDKIEKSYWFCEGDEEALSVIKELISKLNGTAVVIDSQNKVLYHCAATIACNYLTTLIDSALLVAEGAKIDRQLAWAAFEPLIQNTIKNISDKGTQNALTGPIARGDLQTLKQHLNALLQYDQDIYNVYKDLGKQTVKLAARNQNIDKSVVQLLLKALQ